MQREDVFILNSVTGDGVSTVHVQSMYMDTLQYNSTIRLNSFENHISIF